MIIKKTWIKYKDHFRRYRYIGWFLLGIIPLYINREDIGN